MKRVLVVITTSLVPYGGLATVAMNYYRNIDKNLIHMDFASTNNLCNSLKNELDINGSKYYKLPSRKKHILFYMWKLWKILKQYDIIHVHANSATATVELLPAVLAKVEKRIVHIHNTTCTHMKIHKFLKPIFNRCYTDAIACSKPAGAWIFTTGYFTVLNNAIDLEKYSYNAENRKKIRNRYGISESEMVIGHVGKIIQQKNHTFLLDVFQQILNKQPLTKLMLVGDGELREKMEKKAEKLQIQNSIFFCGMQNDASSFLSAFDVVVFPSLWEGVPLAILEAQANGLLCIISDNITSEVEMGGYSRYPFQKKPLYGLI